MHVRAFAFARRPPPKVDDEVSGAQEDKVEFEVEAQGQHYNYHNGGGDFARSSDLLLPVASFYSAAAAAASAGGGAVFIIATNAIIAQVAASGRAGCLPCVAAAAAAASRKRTVAERAGRRAGEREDSPSSGWLAERGCQRVGVANRVIAAAADEQ